MAEAPTEKNPLAYKGSIAGLKGLLSSKIAEGLASVADTLERITDSQGEGGTQPIPLEKIRPCAEQPRQVFEPQALEELAQTMREVGQAQAITVRRVENGLFEIISGERRYRAAKLAGLEKLDCVIKDCSEREARLLALVENVQRQDLLPIEEAFYLKRVLSDNPELSLDKLAKLLGSHKSTLSEKIQLSEVPEDLQPLLYGKGRHFTHRHWRVISRIGDPAYLRQIYQRAVEQQLSVAELERALDAAGVKRAVRRRSDGHMAAQPKALASLLRVDGQSLRLRSASLDLSKLSSEHREQLALELEAALNLLRSLAPAQAAS